MHAHAQVCTCAGAGAEPLTQDAVQEGAESRCCGHEADGDVFADAVAFDLQCILGTRLSTPRLGPNTCKCVGMRVRMCMHAFIHSCVHVCVVSRCVVLCITPFKHHPLCAPCLSLLLSLPLSASLDLSRPLSTSLSGSLLLPPRTGVSALEGVHLREHQCREVARAFEQIGSACVVAFVQRCCAASRHFQRLHITE